MHRMAEIQDKYKHKNLKIKVGLIGQEQRVNGGKRRKRNIKLRLSWEVGK